MKRRFTVLLPRWVDKNATLILLANQELVAYAEPGKRLKIKSVRCNQCGECCMDLGPEQTPFGTDDEGKCTKLIKEGDKWLCTAGAQKPFCCLSDPNEFDIEDLDCCIRY